MSSQDTLRSHVESLYKNFATLRRSLKAKSAENDRLSQELASYRRREMALALFGSTLVVPNLLGEGAALSEGDLKVLSQAVYGHAEAVVEREREENRVLKAEVKRLTRELRVTALDGSIREESKDGPTTRMAELEAVADMLGSVRSSLDIGSPEIREGGPASPTRHTVEGLAAGSLEDSIRLAESSATPLPEQPEALEDEVAKIVMGSPGSSPERPAGDGGVDGEIGVLERVVTRLSPNYKQRSDTPPRIQRNESEEIVLETPPSAVVIPETPESSGSGAAEKSSKKKKKKGRKIGKSRTPDPSPVSLIR